MSATAAVDCPAGSSRTLPGEVSAHMLRCPRASAASIRVLISSLGPVLSCAAVTARAPRGKRRGLPVLLGLMALMRSNMVARFCKWQLCTQCRGRGGSRVYRRAVEGEHKFEYLGMPVHRCTAQEQRQTATWQAGWPANTSNCKPGA